MNLVYDSVWLLSLFFNMYPSENLIHLGQTVQTSVQQFRAPFEGTPILIPPNFVKFLVYFNSFEVSRSHSLKVSKSYDNNQVTSIKKLLGVPHSFSLLL